MSAPTSMLAVTAAARNAAPSFVSSGTPCWPQARTVTVRTRFLVNAVEAVSLEPKLERGSAMGADESAVALVEWREKSSRCLLGGDKVCGIR